MRDLATVLQELKHFSRVKLPGDRIHIHEDRVRPTVSDGIHRCDERQRWDQHLIVGPHSGDKQGDVQRDRPIGGRHRLGQLECVFASLQACRPLAHGGVALVQFDIASIILPQIDR